MHGTRENEAATTIRFKGVLLWATCPSMLSCLAPQPNNRKPRRMFWNYYSEPSNSWAAMGSRSGATPIKMELMLERTYDLPEEREWMARRDSWMSNTTHSEVIRRFSHTIRGNVVSHASKSTFYDLTADGTTDVSPTEQFPCN